MWCTGSVGGKAAAANFATNLPLEYLVLLSFSCSTSVVSCSPALIIDIIFMMKLMYRTGYWLYKS
jgi:hypothetical protein